MVRKFINRKLSAEDEWSHIAEHNNPTIDDVDALDVQDRTLFFNDEAQVPQTNYEKTKDATRTAMDKAGNTGQYIKYVNAHFEKKNSEINKIKELKNKFDREVNLLRQEQDTPRFDLNAISAQTKDKDRLHELKEKLQKEHQITKSYLNDLKSSIAKTESEIHRQVEELHAIDNSIKNPERNSDEIQAKATLSEDLKNLSEKYDAKTMLEILKGLEASLGKNEVKNASQ